MNHDPSPTNIEDINSDGTLNIDWSDGHHSEYSLFGLRNNCPCVIWRAGHGSMNTYDRTLFFVEPTINYAIEEIQQAGNQAIKIFWNDGHSDGMYQWNTLRAMCPCKACSPEQS